MGLGCCCFDGLDGRWVDFNLILFIAQSLKNVSYFKIRQK